MATKKKEVATKEEQMPAFLQGKEGSNRGSENVTSQDMQLPRISIIQALSPQRKSKDAKYIEGAEEGMLFNTLTEELFPDGIFCVPVHFDKQYLAWVEQDSGGGLLGIFDNMQEAEAAAAASDKPAEAVETPTNIVILTDAEGNPLGEATIPMSKSKMKVSRAWNSLVRMNQGDRFSRRYKIVPVEETNANNQDYFNFKVTNAGFPSQEAYEQAESLYENIAAGNVKVSADYSDEEAGGSTDSDDNGEY